MMEYEKEAIRSRAKHDGVHRDFHTSRGIFELEMECTN